MKRVFYVFVFFLLIVGCSDNNNEGHSYEKVERERDSILYNEVVSNDNHENLLVASNEEKGNQAEEDFEGKKSAVECDSTYKIFYGEWEIISVLGENQRFGADDNSLDIIGYTFYMDSTILKINNEIISSNPCYSVKIIPTSVKSYFKMMPTIDELGIVGEYYCYVESYPDKEFNSPIGAVQFFVKDDTTIIIFTRNAYYEVIRKEYIPKYELEYEGI